LPGPSRPELLIINSEGFTLWDAQFASLQRCASAFAPSRILTVVKAQHISFSDFPLITPRRFHGGVGGKKVLNGIGTLAEAFLEGQVGLGDPELAVEGVFTRKMMVEKNAKGENVLLGEVGDVVVH
jgi:platelet-activating factor acetylhydrolase